MCVLIAPQVMPISPRLKMIRPVWSPITPPRALAASNGRIVVFTTSEPSYTPPTFMPTITSDVTSTNGRNMVMPRSQRASFLWALPQPFFSSE